MENTTVKGTTTKAQGTRKTTSAKTTSAKTSTKGKTRKTSTGAAKAIDKIKKTPGKATKVAPSEISFAGIKPLSRIMTVEYVKAVDILKNLNLRNENDELDMTKIKKTGKTIVVPSYQRKMLKAKNPNFVPGLQASILLSLGVSATIILALNEDGLKELVDGLQRLSALHDIFINDVKFCFRKVKINLTKEEREYLQQFDGLSLSDMKRLCPDIYENVMNLQLTVNTYIGLDRASRISLFDKLNASSSALTKDERNHACYEGTPLYKSIAEMSKKCEDVKSERFGQQINFISSNLKYKRDNYLLKLAVSVATSIQNENYSTQYTQLISEALESDDFNSVENTEDVEDLMRNALRTIRHCELRPLLNQIHISPVDGKKKASDSTFLFLCLFYFAHKNETMLKENFENGIDTIEILKRYIDTPNYKTSKLAAANHQHTNTTGKVIVNAYVWKKILEDALANEDDNSLEFDFNAAEQEAKDLIGGK